jgi:hypothetical protein
LHRKLFVRKYTIDLLVARRNWKILDLKRRHNDDNAAVFQQACIRMIISEILMGRAYSSLGEKRHAYTVLEGKPEVKRSLEKSRDSGRIILKWDRKYIL